MYCKRCSGRIFVDRVFSQKTHIELFCMSCGKRWFIKREGNGFGRWLSRIERNLYRDYGTSI